MYHQINWFQCRQFHGLCIQSETDLSSPPSTGNMQKNWNNFSKILREIHTQNAIRTMNSIILGILWVWKCLCWAWSSFILLECIHRRGSNLHLFIGSQLEQKKNESSVSSSSHWYLSTQQRLNKWALVRCVCECVDVCVLVFFFS